jgi:recombination protein RecA
MSQALRKLVGAIKRSNTAVIFTNQLRMKIGIMFGNPETTTGGNALKFYAAVRLDIRPMEAIKQGGEVIGTRARVRVKKNKLAPPFKTAEFDIVYNEGISKSGDVLDLGTEVGVVEKKGAYYTYGEMRLGQGRENAKAFLKEHPEIMAEVAQKIRQSMTSSAAKSFGVIDTTQVQEKEETLGYEQE